MLKDNAAYVGFLEGLDRYRVVDMDDGGMGSVRFVVPGPQRHRRFGERIADAEYRDEDGVPILVAINLDDAGELFEIDVWKVDYSPTRKYPSPPEH